MLQNRRKIGIFVYLFTLVFMSSAVFALSRIGNNSKVNAPISDLPPTTLPIVQKPAPVTPHVPTPTPTPVPIAVEPKPQSKTKYKNGTYNATGSYDSPAGVESIDVSITLSGDAITSSSVTPLAQDRRSMRYQEAFIGGYQPYVIGKNIDSIQLDVVSGASLTPAGFNDALQLIKSRAISA